MLKNKIHQIYKEERNPLKLSQSNDDSSASLFNSSMVYKHSEDSPDIKIKKVFEEDESNKNKKSQFHRTKTTAQKKVFEEIDEDENSQRSRKSENSQKSSHKSDKLLKNENFVSSSSPFKRTKTMNKNSQAHKESIEKELDDIKQEEEETMNEKNANLLFKENNEEEFRILTKRDKIVIKLNLIISVIPIQRMKVQKWKVRRSHV